MKKICFLIIILVPLVVKSQALLGFSIEDIKANFSENSFEKIISDNGRLMYRTEFEHGDFIYVFDKETLLSNTCMLFPNNLANLNALVELYNKEYVVVSDSSWKAYLDNGTIMKVELIFDTKNKIYFFVYKP